MSTFVPLHALILDLTGSEFPAHEILDPNVIARSISPRLTPTDMITVDEIAHRVRLKLAIGERAVLHPGLDSSGRLRMAMLARNLGVPAIWVVPPQSDRDLMRGDGAAEVIVAQNVQPVLPQGEEIMCRPYAGITVIGDVHGMHHSLLTALAWARSRNHFVMLLGDVIDYGQATLECADEVWRLIMRGEGCMVLGNHERKIMRWLGTDQEGRRNLRMSDGNKVTLSAYNRLGFEQREAWSNRFRGLIWHAATLRYIEDVVMAHAAVHPRYWQGERDRAVDEFALFGEPDPNVRPPRFATSYRWVDAIPAGKTVIVGHDVRSTKAPRSVEGALGGKAVFLDTGCGKGGRLSSADLRFTDTGLRLMNLNLH